MKNCLTCGSTVADDASVCPDCGMELDSAPASSFSAPGVPASNTAPNAVAPNPVAPEGGFTVEFGADVPPASPPAENLFDADLSQSEAVPVTPAMAPAFQAAPAPAVTNVMAKITLKRGGALTVESFLIGPGAIVGRFDPESGPVDVDLAPLPEGSYVSRHHVEFRHDAGNDTWLIKDMGSRNGTFWRAGGQGAFSRITTEQILASGDEISLGNARFEFFAG